MGWNWVAPALLSSVIFFTLLVAFDLYSRAGSPGVPPGLSAHPKVDEGEAGAGAAADGLPSPNVSLPQAPRLAYMISGSRGDGERLRRAIQALYHPRNYYVLHMDAEAPLEERADLAAFVRLDPTFQKVGNVHVMSKSNPVTYRGVSMVTTTLEGAAILLKKFADWDWFINLSASDYPLVTQDDLLHVFSFLPRDVNFIEHTSKLAWKMDKRVKPIVIDPAVYMSRKTALWKTPISRASPTAFRVFSGSAWAVLSRSFMEFTIMGWDNLPRAALLYFGSVVSSPEFYFHTVVCNAREFRNTTVNHDLHYIKWDNPPRQHPKLLGDEDFKDMTESGAAFARKFRDDDSALRRIDEELLGRDPGQFTPGGWCQGRRHQGQDPCMLVGDSSTLRPGPGSQRLERLVSKLLHPPAFRSNQCMVAESSP